VRTNGRGTLIALVAGVILVAVVALGAGFAMTHYGNFGGGRALPPPVQPIHIPAAACPFLRAVSVTVNRAGEGWTSAITDSPKQWRGFAKQLAPKLASFELALRTAIPHTPRAVSRDLSATLHQVRVGRVHLAASRDFFDYEGKSHDAVTNGLDSITHASQLVGRACGGLLISF
jgi:hypothetical protein